MERFAIIIAAFWQVQIILAASPASPTLAQSAPPVADDKVMKTKHLPASKLSWLQMQDGDSVEVKLLRTKVAERLQLLAEDIETFGQPFAVPPMDAALPEAGGDVSEWIRKVVLPNIKKTVDSIEAEVKKKHNEVEECKQLLWSGEKETEHRERVLQEDEEGKFNCLGEEHRLHKDQVDKCGSYDSMAKFLTEHDLRDFEGVNRSQILLMDEIMKENVDFHSEYIAKFGSEQQMCQTATAAAQRQHEICGQDEEHIEEFYCAMKKGRDDACASYDSCYKEKQPAYSGLVTKMRQLETHVKEHFKNMACFSNGIGAERDSGDCDHGMIETAHLDVDYPADPTEEECIHLMKTRRDYSEIKCVDGYPVTTTTAAVPAAKASNETSANPNVTAPASPVFEPTVAPTKETPEPAQHDYSTGTL